MTETTLGRSIRIGNDTRAALLGVERRRAVFANAPGALEAEAATKAGVA